MKFIQLYFKSLSEVVGNDNLAVITLIDSDHRRTLTFVCDNDIKLQLAMRTNGVQCAKRLPEVLARAVGMSTDWSCGKIEVCSLVAGEYQALLLLQGADTPLPIRLSDAVLLSLITDCPIMMDSQLFYKQSSVYMGNDSKTLIPVNILDDKQLEKELEKAVNAENYHLAAYIQEELKKRKNIGK